VWEGDFGEGGGAAGEVGSRDGGGEEAEAVGLEGGVWERPVLELGKDEDGGRRDVAKADGLQHEGLLTEGVECR